MPALSTKLVRVDEEAYEAIKRQAQPLESINGIIRRLLGLPPPRKNGWQKGGRPRKKK